MAGIVTYIKESFEELKNNVTWTPWAEAQRLTVVVAVFSIIFSLFIWAVDVSFADLISGKLFATVKNGFKEQDGTFSVNAIRGVVVLLGIVLVAAPQFSKKKN